MNDVFVRWFEKWYFLFELTGGLFVVLHVFGYLPFRPKSDDAIIWARWREKYGVAMAVLGIGLIVAGSWHLIAILNFR
jgi:hypothetical protein